MASKDGRAYKQLSPRSLRAMDAVTDVSEWDNEELKRGYRRDRNGHFRGMPPRVIPRSCHVELMRRMFSQVNTEMLWSLPDAIKTLQAIMTSDFAEDRDRLKAIDMLLSRVMGKPVEKVEVAVSADPPWMEALKGGIVDVDVEDESIEAQAHEVEQDEWDDDDIILEDE